MPKNASAASPSVSVRRHQAIKDASKTIRNIKSIYVKDMQAVVDNNNIVSYRLNAKISFLLEDSE